MAPRTLRTLRAVRGDTAAPTRGSRDAPEVRDTREVRGARGARDARDAPVSGLRRRAVGLARLLTGGLLALAAAVALLPPVLGDRGPGVGAVVWHVVVALIALGASLVAADRRTSPPLALGAALVVPLGTLALLCGYWWA